METALSSSTAAPRSQDFGATLLVWLLPGLALAAGLAAGTVDRTMLMMVGAVVGLAVVLWSASRPAVALQWLAAQTVFFPVIPVSQGRGFNPIDLLLPGALAGAWLWYLDRRADGAGAPAIERARRGIVRSSLAYYALAVFTLVLMAARGRPGDAVDSLLVLSRSVQGALFFFLVSRLVRDRRDLERVRNAVLIGVGVAFALNLFSMVFAEVPRAGAVWALGETNVRSGAAWNAGVGGWTVTNPNELSMGCLFVWALLLAAPMRGFANTAALGLTTVLLFLTLSRAGLASWFVLVIIYGARGGHRSVWILPLLAVIAIPLLPDEYRGRMLRTLTLERGSFEAYSSLIRVFCWNASFATFLANPILGVGYLGFRFVSTDYNVLGLNLLTSESFFLETGSGMGVVGLAVLAWFAFATLRFARVVRRLSDRGSIADRFARVAPAYLAAVALANLTGDLLIGLLCVSQLALFLGLFTQAARMEDLRVAAAPSPRVLNAPAPSPATA
jgi:hypothetical protein